MEPRKDTAGDPDRVIELFGRKEGKVALRSVCNFDIEIKCSCVGARAYIYIGS